MGSVNVICVGKLKEAYWRDACAEYLKRLGAFCKPAVVELPESRLSQNPSDGEIAAALRSEAKLMTSYVEQKGAYNIAMCIEGKMLSSEELAAKLEQAGVSGFGTVNFFIGSSFGLDDEIKRACDLRLSISRMTLPHQLARVVLMEQVYRGYSIISGNKYHK